MVFEKLNEKIEHSSVDAFLKQRGFDGAFSAVTFADLIKRGITLADICQNFDILQEFEQSIKQTVEIYIKYEGYLKKGREQIERAKKLEEKLLPENINYAEIDGLRLEAKEKLEKIRPASLGQAARISGVNPADIAVLMVYLTLKK